MRGLVRPHRWRLTGGAAAAALLSKVNLGVFFLAGLALARTAATEGREWWRRAVAVGCTAMPLVLMARHLKTPH